MLPQGLGSYLNGISRLGGAIKSMKQQGMSEQQIEKTTNKLLEADKKTTIKRNYAAAPIKP